MLLATTVMLLVFRSPSAIISVMWLISARMFIEEKPPFRLRKFHSIANLCATLNAATTFIMFIIYGTKFRSEFTRLYCCILTKFQKPKQTTTTIRQGQQQMKQLISNNDQNENINDVKTKQNLSVTNKSNGNFYLELLKDNHSAATSLTTTSGASSSPMKHLVNEQKKQRYSYDEEHDLMISHAKNTHRSPRQHEVSIREDEDTDNHNDTKVVSLTESYFDWFKNLIGCH
jgi:hypothetical protein